MTLFQATHGSVRRYHLTHLHCDPTVSRKFTVTLQDFRWRGSPRLDFRASLLNGAPKDADTVAFEDHRKKYLEIFKRLRAENPDLPIGELEKLATAYVVSEAPKSRAFYRIQVGVFF